MASVQDIVDLLNEMVEDEDTSNSLQEKLSNVIKMLNKEEELSIKLNKASHSLDELASGDMDSFTRTQLMGIIGALETVEE